MNIVKKQKTLPKGDKSLAEHTRALTKSIGTNAAELQRSSGQNKKARFKLERAINRRAEVLEVIREQNPTLAETLIKEIKKGGTN
ncbi:MAG: hypothetical protein Q8P86_02175 [bacterium]|nr:hypothetical protein [bacterium]